MIKTRISDLYKMHINIGQCMNTKHFYNCDWSCKVIYFTANSRLLQYISFLISVEIIASLGNFGISIGFPGGFLCERFGARVTALVGLVVSVAGFLLLWSTTLMKEYYQEHAFLQYVYFFIAGNV